MQGAPEIDADLLHRLLVRRSPQPLDELVLGSGLTPGRVSDRLDVLREAGCVIDEHPRRGLRLIHSGLGCWADYIEHRHAGRLGHDLTVFRETASTQEAARRLIGGAGDAGRVVAADHQTAGRGRLGRRWLAAPGEALLMSVIVERRGEAGERLVIGSCCAAAEAVERLTGLRVRIRWPNDLLIGEAKLAGILVESVGERALVGIGVNVSGRPASLPSTGPPFDQKSTLRDQGSLPAAACLSEHGASVDRLRLLDELLDRLEHNLYAASVERLHAGWKARSCLLQRRITVEADARRLTGRVLDLDPEHGLMLQLDRGGLVACPAATTSLLAWE